MLAGDICYNIRTWMNQVLFLFIMYVVHELITPKRLDDGEVRSTDLIEIRKLKGQVYDRVITSHE